MPGPPAAGAPARWLSGGGLAIAIVAIIVASSIAVLAFTKEDGASSSQQATLDLLAAVQANDVLGVLEQLPPGERKAVRESVEKVATELQQVGLLLPVDLRHVQGPTTEISSLLLRSTELSKDMDAVDLVGGTITFRLPAGDAPLTERARKNLETYAHVVVDPAGVSITRDLAADPLRVIAIREGGGWHVSLAYTVAELVRSAAEVGFPEMGKGPPPIGATSPDAVVRDLLNAYVDADAERVVTLLYPDESRAIYDYAPAFLPQADILAAAAADGHTYDVQLNDLKTTVEGSGASRTVKVTAFDIEIRDQVKKAHLTYDGRCLHLDHRVGDNGDPYEKWDVCDNDLPKPGDALMPRLNPIVNLSIFGGGVDLPTFVVVERGGRWFLSPARTLLDSIVSTIRGKSLDAVDAFAQRLADSVRAGAGEGLTGHPVVGLPPPADSGQDEATKAAARARAQADALIQACAGLAEGPRADEVNEACLDQLVATGRLDASLRP